MRMRLLKKKKMNKKQFWSGKCSSLGFSTYFTFDDIIQFNGNCTYVAARHKDRSDPRYFEVRKRNLKK